VLTAFIIRALMMEAVRTSETSVNFYQTIRLKIPEGSHLYLMMLFQPEKLSDPDKYKKI
jgi:hypothetical protein